jgi:hypothetical protein
MLAHDVTLPSRQPDRSQMLVAGAVLRQQARPVHPVRLHRADPIGITPADSAGRRTAQSANRAHHLLGDRRVVGADIDSEHRHASRRHQMPVAEVLPEDLAVVAAQCTGPPAGASGAYSAGPAIGIFRDRLHDRMVAFTSDRIDARCRPRVPPVGFEPTCLSAMVFETTMYASSITGAIEPRRAVTSSTS